MPQAYNKENKMVDLAKLIVPSKELTIEYPGFPGFEVTLAYLTRDELLAMRKKCTTVKFNKSRQPEDEVNTELFQEVYIKAVLKNWKGFKYKYLAKLVPVDLSEVEDLEDELDYSPDNAEALMKNAKDFDSWVSDILDDVENFTKSS